MDIPGLSSLYKPENEVLTYKELLDVCEDVIFELTNEQITEIESIRELNKDVIYDSSIELDE